jgi:hypothetical protein
MKDLIQIQAELKALHQEFLELAEKIKANSKELGVLVKDSNNALLKWQVHHHWLQNVDRKFKILDIELEKEIHGEKREAGRKMAMDYLQEKIKAMEELEPSDDEEDNEHRRVTINILKDRHKELEQEAENETNNQTN